jgi:hypothetical protein
MHDACKECIPTGTAPSTAFPDRALLACFFEHLFQLILLPQAQLGTSREGKMGQWTGRENKMSLTQAD